MAQVDGITSGPVSASGSNRETKAVTQARRSEGVPDAGWLEWRGTRRTCIVIATLFFIKFAAFSLYLTPFWDIPDESGHYAYVEDLSHGHLPVLGEARMSQDVADSWIGPGARRGRNWIAQHPPLFYSLAAPVVAAVRASGGDFSAQVHAARLVSSLIGALAILGMMAFLTVATGRRLLGIAGGVFLGATPMFTQLGSGVTHDTLVACTVAWACYWLVRWLDSNRLSHALWCAFIAGLSCVTKITALPMAIPLFFLMALWMLRTRGLSTPLATLARIGLIWLVMFAPVVIWGIHNFLHFHEMFPNAGLLNVYPDNPTEMGFWEYMQKYPIWQVVLLNFIGLIGWMGTVPGSVVTVQANGFIAQLFVGILLFCSSFSILHASRLLRDDRRQLACLAIVAVSCIALGLTISTYRYATITCIAIFIMTAWIGLRSLPTLLNPSARPWLMLTGCICIAFFTVLYYHHIWENYTQIGRVKALHGRYFYTVMPFLSLLMLWPLRKGLLPVAAVAVAAVSLFVSDAFFLHDAFVMYGLF